MAKKRPKKFSDQIRAAVENCGVSRYQIWQETGIDAGALCHFVAGRRGLSMDSLDKLADYIGLRVETVDRPRKKGR